MSQEWSQACEDGGSFGPATQTTFIYIQHIFYDFFLSLRFAKVIFVIHLKLLSLTTDTLFIHEPAWWIPLDIGDRTLNVSLGFKTPSVSYHIVLLTLTSAVVTPWCWTGLIVSCSGVSVSMQLPPVHRSYQNSTGHCVSFLTPHEWLKTDEACARVIIGWTVSECVHWCQFERKFS